MDLMQSWRHVESKTPMTTTVRIINALKLASKAETMAVLLSYAFAHVNYERSTAKAHSALQLNGETLKIRDDFMSVTKASTRLDTNTEESFAARKARGEVLFEFFMRYARLQVLSKDGDLVEKFVESRIRDDTQPLDKVDLRVIDTKFEAYMRRTQA